MYTKMYRTCDAFHKKLVSLQSKFESFNYHVIANFAYTKYIQHM